MKGRTKAGHGLRYHRPSGYRVNYSGGRRLCSTSSSSLNQLMCMHVSTEPQQRTPALVVAGRTSERSRRRPQHICPARSSSSASPS